MSQLVTTAISPEAEKPKLQNAPTPPEALDSQLQSDVALRVGSGGGQSHLGLRPSLGCRSVLGSLGEGKLWLGVTSVGLFCSLMRRNSKVRLAGFLSVSF